MVENLKPIAETLKTEDLKLVKSLKELLSEKQYGKWIKYNRKQGKFFPKEEESTFFQYLKTPEIYLSGFFVVMNNCNIFIKKRPIYSY